jgi:tripartite-type tricarboxylate transporter receptor subunit TctC
MMFKTAVAAALAAWIGLTGAHAQEWAANKPIRFVVPQVTGGGADAIGRAIAKGISDQIGQPLVVENRPGANGGVGVESLMRAPADGYSLLLVFTSLMALNPAVYAKLPYDPLKDFTPLAGMCEVPLVMMASNAVNARDAAELVKLERSQPGKIDAASSGNGAFSHLLIEMMNAKTGTRFTHIPFKGEAPAVQHLMGDHGPIIYIGTPALAIAHQNSGRLKLLAVTTQKRMPQLPEVRTLAEQGFTEFNESFWYGVVVSSATPPNIATALQRHAQQAANQPAVQEQLGRHGCGPLPLSAADFDKRIRSDHAKYTGIARAVGMKVD